MSLNIDKFKEASQQVVELAEKVNSAGDDVKYALKRDLRKAAQSAKVEAQAIRVAVNALGKKAVK